MNSYLVNYTPCSSWLNTPLLAIPADLCLTMILDGGCVKWYGIGATGDMLHLIDEPVGMKDQRGCTPDYAHQLPEKKWENTCPNFYLLCEYLLTM